MGFYGFFILAELHRNALRYQNRRFVTRVLLALSKASTNLLVEFAPAETLDNFLVRPFTMYLVPQFVHPYPVGFLAGKFSADAIFYIFAIVGYEVRKRWLH